MNKRSLSIGIIVTATWIAIIVFIFLYADLKHPESLNEFGDFLAGVFAPIAFFWLILGYMQQGKQLEQNTKALEQQERALQLQIDEMREGIKQQKEIATIQKQQFDAMNHAAMPSLIIDSCNCETYIASNEKISTLKIMLKIYNRGVGEALDIRAEIKNTNFPVISKLKVEEVTLETIYLSSDISDLSIDLSFFTIPLILIYKNKFDVEIRENYLVKAYFIYNSWEIESSFIIKK